MADKIYTIPENPVYDPKIRELQNTDPANAETVFNPLFSKIINNVHAVKLAEDVEKAKTDRHIADKTNPHALSKAQVGLGNVDNIKQAAKAELDGHTGNVDIHTSAGEKARLEQELGGKVTARTQAISSWEQLIKSSSGYYTIMPNVVGMPIVNSFWNCQIISDDRDISGYYSRTFIAFMVGTHELKYQIPWIKNIVNGNDYGWFQLVGALPSQEFPLPLAAGYLKMDSHRCDYSKSQDGTVVVHVAVKHTSGSLPRGYNAIGTLPIGFCPSEIVGTPYPTGGFFINPSGSVNTAFSADYKELIETLVFRTAQ